MKNRIFAVMLAVSSLSAIQASAFTMPVFDGTQSFDDPFNNDLFEVVAEVNMPEGVWFSTDFKYETVVWKDDEYKFYKDVQVNIGYDGSVTLTDLSDFKEFDDREGLDDSDSDGDYIDPKEGVFNDGLVYTTQAADPELNIDPEYFWNDIIFKDINGEIIYEGSDAFHSFDYNLGLLSDVETAYAEDYDFVSHTTLIKVMTDKEKYVFDGYISAFNDDGYSLYQENAAEQKGYVIKLKKGIIPTVYYNGSKIKFDQIPVIEDGRTLVPLRAIFEILGAEVDWNGDTQTVTAKKDDTEISLTINNTTASKNGESISLDVPAKVVSGRTLVPVRFVADCFGVGVDWDGDMQRVLLTSD